MTSPFTDVNSFVFSNQGGQFGKSAPVTTTGSGVSGYNPSSLPNYGSPGGVATQTFQPGAQGNVAGLTSEMNALNVQGQTQANAARIPGSTALETQSSGNIAQELQGNVPTDVINLIGQQAAERGISGANTNAAYLRALGLTSLQQQQQGQANLSAADARNPGAPLFDPTSQLLTPYQAGSLNLQGSSQQLESQRMQQQLALEQQRLQQSAYGGGGGGYGGSGGGGGYQPPNPYGNDPVTQVYGATGPTSTYDPSQDYMNELYRRIPTGGTGIPAAPVDYSNTGGSGEDYSALGY
jgi:hypothetical protein